MIDVDSVVPYTQPDQTVVLGREVLLVGGASRIAEEKRRHGTTRLGGPAHHEGGRYRQHAKRTSSPALISAVHRG